MGVAGSVFCIALERKGIASDTIGVRLVLHRLGGTDFILEDAALRVESIVVYTHCCRHHMIPRYPPRPLRKPPEADDGVLFIEDEPRDLSRVMVCRVVRRGRNRYDICSR